MAEDNVNPWRGEVSLVVNGKRRTAKLTLGALAELEAELETDTLIELITRFEEGRFSVSDILALLTAGLRGGGWRGTRRDLLRAEIEGGPLAATKAAGQLLARSFALPGQ